MVFCGQARLVVPSDTEFDTDQHLTYADIAVDDKNITVNIKQSKTDQLRKGVTVVIGRAGRSLCLFVAILSYIGMRRPGKGPLFHSEDGSPLL